jgi:hypothetical protein
MPPRRIVRNIGIADAELIVVIHLDPCLGQEGLHRFEIIVRKAGATVEEQNLHRTGAHLLGPDLVFASGHRNHADTRYANSAGIQSVCDR